MDRFPPWRGLSVLVTGAREGVARFMTLSFRGRCVDPGPAQQSGSAQPLHAGACARALPNPRLHQHANRVPGKGSEPVFSLISGVTAAAGTGLWRIKTPPPTAIRICVHENLSLLWWHRVDT